MLQIRVLGAAAPALAPMRLRALAALPLPMGSANGPGGAGASGRVPAACHSLVLALSEDRLEVEWGEEASLLVAV